MVPVSWLSNFDKLKRAISSEPVLKLLEFDKPFKVETDASDRTIGAVLVQEGRPVAFELETTWDGTAFYCNRKGDDCCSTLLAALDWRHYLLGGKFEIQTDNVAMSYFDTKKKKLTPKQAQ